MRELLAARLTKLRQEYDAGQNMLADLEGRRLDLQQTLLRIGGAIQVLEELLAEQQPPSANGATAASAERAEPAAPSAAAAPG